MPRQLPPSRRHVLLTPLTTEQLAALPAACGSTRPIDARDRAILALLTTTGLRASELCALTLDSPHDGYLTVCSTKTQHVREVRLPHDTERDLRNYLTHSRTASQQGERTLFLTQDEQPLDPGALASIVQAAARRAHLGATQVTVALIRYSVAALLFGARQRL